MVPPKTVYLLLLDFTKNFNAIFAKATYKRMRMRENERTNHRKKKKSTTSADICLTYFSPRQTECGKRGVRGRAVKPNVRINGKYFIVALKSVNRIIKFYDFVRNFVLGCMCQCGIYSFTLSRSHRVPLCATAIIAIAIAIAFAWMVLV